jgi:hypothetical protein
MGRLSRDTALAETLRCSGGVLASDFGSSLPPFVRRQTEASAAESAEQLTALHLRGPCFDHLRTVRQRNVVVIALEAAARNSDRVGEAVQLVVGVIADEVAPLLAPVPPSRFVNQDGHGVQPARLAA